MSAALELPMNVVFEYMYEIYGLTMQKYLKNADEIPVSADLRLHTCICLKLI